MYVHPQVVRHWLIVGVAALGAVCGAVLGVIWFVMSRRPSANLLEERRRKRLATVGRIVDGNLGIDAESGGGYAAGNHLPVPDCGRNVRVLAGCVGARAAGDEILRWIIPGAGAIQPG